MQSGSTHDRPFPQNDERHRRKALDEVSEKLGISWAIGEGKIVFTNADGTNKAIPGTP